MPNSVGTLSCWGIEDFAEDLSRVDGGGRAKHEHWLEGMRGSGRRRGIDGSRRWAKNPGFSGSLPHDGLRESEVVCAVPTEFCGAYRRRDKLGFAGRWC